MLARAIIAMVAVLLWGCSSSPAAGVVRLDGATTELPLTPFLSFYRDASGQMTLAQVQQQWARGQFSPGAQRRPSFGFTQDAIWVRFVMQHQGPHPAMWILELQTPRMDTVDAYLVRSSGPVEHFAAGNLPAPSPQVVDAIRPAFPFSLQPGEEAEFFLRVHSETSLQLPLSIWGVKQYATAQARMVMFSAGFFGYLSALVTVGLLFGGVSWERGMVFYSLSLVGVLAGYLIVSGYWTWLGFPRHTVLAKQGGILAGEFALFMMIVFLRRLFDLGLVMPRVDQWMARFMWAGAAATLVLLALPYRISYPLFLGHLLLLGVALMLVAFAAWHRGLRVARFYSLAWVVFWASYGVSSILFLARQPMPHLPWVYTLVGVAASSTLFLFAIADRVREIRQSALKAQVDLLAVERQASEDLRLKMRQEQLLIRDLHDGIGGLTANLAILAELGRRSAAADAEREQFARISSLASDGSAEVRSLMKSLEARDMSWADFFAEFRQHGQMALPPHGIEFTLTETGDTDQPGPGVYAGLSIMRLLKEALNNAVKHAACTRVTVVAEFTPHQLRLRVRDNGRGLPSVPPTGRGLRNMASRIREIGGAMTRRSENGVELVFELPLPVKLVSPPPTAQQ